MPRKYGLSASIFGVRMALLQFDARRTGKCQIAIFRTDNATPGFQAVSVKVRSQESRITVELH